MNVFKKGGAHPLYFKLSNPIEEAKALLEAEGYVVTSPLPKRSGKIYVYHFPDFNPEKIRIRSQSDYESTVVWGREPKIIKIIDWTED